MPRLRERGDQREAAFRSIRVVSAFIPRRSAGRTFILRGPMEGRAMKRLFV
jgi:hypothetical protein